MFLGEGYRMYTNEKIPYEKVSDLHFLKQLVYHFPKPFPEEFTVENNYSIPKILHFIWIESVLPKKYLKNINSFAEMNPDYKTIIWIDKEIPQEFELHPKIEIKKIEELDLPLLHKMCKLSTRIDYIRYEIIHIFGGIYSDIDSYPLNPFDEVVEKSFVSYGDTNTQNSFFGFPPKSSFISYLLSTISHYANMNESERGDIFHGKFTGGNLFGACIGTFQDDNIRCISEFFTGQASPHKKVSEQAYCRQTYDYNWGDPNDPTGKN